MYMKRKVSSLLAAGLLLIPNCGNAASSPAYLTDGVIEYPLSVVAQKTETVIGMPQERANFSYAFTEGEVQYSDFLIAPQSFSAGVKLSVRGETAHTLTVELVDKETGEVAERLTDVPANTEMVNEYILSTLSPLQFRHGYYFRLSKPSVQNAVGTLTVEMLGQEAEKMLRSMQVISGYENGQFIPLRSITRAEMCSMLAKAAGYTEVPPRQVFDDVPAAHWASSYIAFCYENGMIKGTGENRFSPDVEITGAEMLTMLVRMLGRAPKAEVMGGHPNGYMIVASQESITKGNPIIGYGSVSRKTAMECLYNSLFVPLMVQNKESEEESFVVMNGQNGVPLDTLYLRLVQAL